VGGKRFEVYLSALSEVNRPVLEELIAQG